MFGGQETAYELDSGIDNVHGCFLQVVERRLYSKHLLLQAVRSKAVNQVANEFFGYT